MPGKLRSRLLRDPIHGDLPVGPLQVAVIDTPPFQRLRYIKQNGLLHFVFPGAIHTRFIHSIGTMYVAGQVFSRLFPAYVPGRPRQVSNRSLRYVGQVFETAALLHDCGHLAFSHSIENLKDEDAFVFPLRTYAAEWDEGDSQLSDWVDEHAEILEPDSMPSHEEIGLLLTGVILNRYERVGEACAEITEQDPSILTQDVRSLLLPDLPPSSHFLDCAESISSKVPSIGEVPSEERADQLREALSTLISGTLDVDRMDYLQRDSHYTGTIYGQYDASVITNALALCVGERGGPTLSVGLHDRAVQAVDDFLWSRYQLFEQVLNHKTNVILNALLAEALPEAERKAAVPLGRPRDFVEFVEFTDDFVMSHVISASLRDRSPEKRMYHNALVAREIPLYLKSIDVTEDGDDYMERVEEEKSKLAERVRSKGYDPDSMRVWPSESHLIKGGGLPFVIDRDKLAGEDIVKTPLQEGGYQLPRWEGERRLPASVLRYHFFVDRRKH